MGGRHPAGGTATDNDDVPDGPPHNPGIQILAVPDSHGSTRFGSLQYCLESPAAIYKPQARSRAATDPPGSLTFDAHGNAWAEGSQCALLSSDLTTPSIAGRSCTADLPQQHFPPSLGRRLPPRPNPWWSAVWPSPAA